MTDENIIASYDHLMAGSRLIQCKIEARAVYHIHQRLALTLRRGRVLLAGDAAHLCNVSFESTEPFHIALLK